MRKSKMRRDPWIMLVFVLSMALLVVIGTIITIQAGESRGRKGGESLHDANQASLSDVPATSFTDSLPDQLEPSRMDTQDKEQITLSGDAMDEPYLITISDNASIVLPRKPNQSFPAAPSFSAKLKLFDEDKLLRYFRGSATDASKSRTEDGTIIYDCSDGSRLWVYAGAFQYDTPAYQMYYFLEPFGDELADNSHYFVSSADLDFLSRDEAIVQARAIASDLGLSIAAGERILTLDAPSLNATQSLLEKSEMWKSERSASKKKYGRKWTKADECYVVLLQPQIDEFPVCRYFCTTRSEESAGSSSEVLIAIGRSGVISVKADGIYSVQSTGNRAGIISFDEAVQSIVTYCDQLIVSDPLHFVKVELALVASNRDKNLGMLNTRKYSLTPMWVFTCEQIFDQGSVKYQDRTFDKTYRPMQWFVDAQTGKVVKKN